MIFDVLRRCVNHGAAQSVYDDIVVVHVAAELFTAHLQVDGASACTYMSPVPFPVDCYCPAELTRPARPDEAGGTPAPQQGSCGTDANDRLPSDGCTVVRSAAVLNFP